MPRLAAIARASIVLPVPGTSSINTLPAADEGDDQRLDLGTLAQDHPLDVVGHPCRELGETGYIRPPRGQRWLALGKPANR